MSAQLHQFPEKLERLAGKIKADLDRRAQSEADWVEATLALCEDLAAARAEFKNNSSFGQWFDAGGFDLNEHDRAAAITMGEDLVRAREVLTTTKRQSLQLICRHEYRLVSGNKTTTAAKRQKALDAFDRIKERGEEPTRKAVKAEAGVGKTTVDEVFHIREAAASAELPPLPLTAQQKLDAWQRKLEAEFEHRVQVESKKRWEELGLPALEKRWTDLERMLKNPRYAVMTKREYNLIMRCLHSDSARNRTDAQLNEAFNIFTGYKLKMINDEEERAEERRKLRSGMPRTVEEMVARKGKVGK